MSLVQGMAVVYTPNLLGGCTDRCINNSPSPFFFFIYLATLSHLILLREVLSVSLYLLLHLSLSLSFSSDLIVQPWNFMAVEVLVAIWRGMGS